MPEPKSSEHSDKRKNGYWVCKHKEKSREVRSQHSFVFVGDNRIFPFSPKCPYAKKEKYSSSNQAQPKVLAGNYIGNKGKAECSDTAKERVCCCRSQTDDQAAQVSTYQCLADAED